MNETQKFLQKFNDMYEDMVCSHASSDQQLAAIAAGMRLLLENQVRILSVLEKLPVEQLEAHNYKRLQAMEWEERDAMFKESQEARKSIAEFDRMK